MAAHPLAGHFSVEASAARLRHYRYVEERMMRMMGGWIALTPELPAKLLLGRHVWDCAQHADLWGRRLPELRAPAQQSEPASGEVVRFMDMVESRERHHETPERLVGLYGVLKPHLLGVYERHLACANPVYEPPTRRILERCLGDEARHAAAGQRVLEAVTGDGERRRRAEAWAETLAVALREAGGITGDAPVLTVLPVEHPRSLDDVVALENRFAVPALPADLLGVLHRHRRAIEAGDLETAVAEASADARDRVRAEYARLAGPFSDSGIVGVARIGAYRMIKLAFRGPEGRVVVQQQWRPRPDGWELRSADIASFEPGS
jgi:hypothetical protein